MSSSKPVLTFNPKNLSIVLNEVNEKFENEGILKERLTQDIWTKLMSYLLQGEYDLALPIRHELHQHIRKKRYEKIHTFKRIVQRLDEIMDRYIPPPDLELKGIVIDDDTPTPTDYDKHMLSPPGSPVEILVYPTSPEQMRSVRFSDQQSKTARLNKRKSLENKINRPAISDKDDTRKQMLLLKANESVLMKTVDDQQLKINKLQATVDSLERRDVTIRDDILSIAGDQEKKIDVVNKAEREIKFLRKELEIKERSLEVSMVERSHLLDRLSATTTSKLSSGSSSIDDINDLNRPTRLADKYSALYEREWCDIFQILTLELKYDQRTAIQILLDILQDAYNFCARTSKEHMQSLEADLLNPFREQSHSKADTDKRQLETSTQNMLSDLRKATACDTIARVQVHLLNTLNKTRNKHYEDTIIRKLTPYIDKCAELCWFMVIQIPVICVDDDTQFKTGVEFDRDMYTFYKTSGSKYDFMVWPALSISKDNIVLAKGVAQPKTEGVAYRITSSSRQSMR